MADHTRWNCGRCGYLALSSPHEDTEEGTEVHKCPECGEQWWLDEFTYGRLHPAATPRSGLNREDTDG